MQVLKSFVDGQGRRLKPGDTLPSGYDTQTLKHYAHHGMVGEPTPSPKPLKSARAVRLDKTQAAVAAPVFASTPAPAQASESKPAETNPAGPEETQSLVGPDVIKA